MHVQLPVMLSPSTCEPMAAIVKSRPQTLLSGPAYTDGGWMNSIVTVSVLKQLPASPAVLISRISNVWMPKAAAVTGMLMLLVLSGMDGKRSFGALRQVHWHCGV